MGVNLLRGWGRRSGLGLGVAVVVWCATGWAWAQGDVPQRMDGATVASVRSGDTIVVAQGGRQYAIWLDATDAPEPGQDGFSEAKQALSDMVLGRQVRIEAIRPSELTKVSLGRVYCGGQSINLQVVEAGWAWYARGEEHFPILAEAQNAASEAGQGLWGAGDEIVAPWEYRVQQEALLAERREDAAERRRAAAEKRRELKEQRLAGNQPAIPTDLKPGLPSEGDAFYVEGTTVDGQPFSSSMYAGKVVLVDFWATWCGPCKAELPNVLANYQQYHDRGFEVIGISLDEDRQALAQFIVEQQIPWVNLFSNDSKATGWKHPMAQYYQVKGIPTVILVDREGRVVSAAARGKTLGRELAKLFDSEAAATPADGEAAATGESTSDD